MDDHAHSKQTRLAQLEAACREQGLPLTVQRRTIFEALLATEEHPTADAVYEVVKGSLPGVSKTTVYRVLDTLVRLHLVTKICHPGAAARFDAKIHQHHHLVCLHCEEVLDLEDPALDGLRLPVVDTAGYEIEEFHIHFRGTCPDCLKKNREATATKSGASGSRKRSAGSSEAKPKTPPRGRRPRR